MNSLKQNLCQEKNINEFEPCTHFVVLLNFQQGFIDGK